MLVISAWSVVVVVVVACCCWCKHSTCTGGGCHQLKLALVVLFHSPTGANTALAPGQLALCGGGQWWWYIVAVEVEVHMKPALTLEQLALCGVNLQ